LGVVENLRERRGLMDAEETAAILGLNSQVLYRKAKAAEIPHFRFLGRVRFDPGVIADWLKGREVC
jgi:predicted DNA-binding transcriptional regulator AlpA